MDDCYFEKKTSLHLQETGTPIQFVHRRSFDDPSGFRLHLNDCIELYAFVSGEADYVIEEECFSLSRGDLLAISPHAVHVPILKKPCAYERFYILIPLSFFSCIHPDPLSPFLSGNNARPKLTDAAKEKALSVLYEISRLCDREDGEGVQLTVLGLILQLLGLINDVKYCADPAPLQEPSGVPLLLRRILQYISLSPQEITSVESIAEAFHISPPYLSSLFKKHVGVTVSSYLRVKKISLAKRLLAEGRSVAFTCYECGFSDSSHFIRTFKQYTGMTPHRYKSLHTQKSSDC